MWKEKKSVFGRPFTRGKTRKRKFQIQGQREEDANVGSEMNEENASENFGRGAFRNPEALVTSDGGLLCS